MKSKDQILLEEVYKKVNKQPLAKDQILIESNDSLAYVADAVEEDIIRYGFNKKYEQSLRNCLGMVGKVIKTLFVEHRVVFANSNSKKPCSVYEIEFPNGNRYNIFSDFVWEPTDTQIDQYRKKVKVAKLEKTLPELEGIF